MPSCDSKMLCLFRSRVTSQSEWPLKSVKEGVSISLEAELGPTGTELLYSIHPNLDESDSTASRSSPGSKLLLRLKHIGMKIMCLDEEKMYTTHELQNSKY